jgi:hypothetical protein
MTSKNNLVKCSVLTLLMMFILKMHVESRSNKYSYIQTESLQTVL